MSLFLFGKEKRAGNLCVPGPLCFGLKIGALLFQRRSVEDLRVAGVPAGTVSAIPWMGWNAAGGGWQLEGK